MDSSILDKLGDPRTSCRKIWDLSSFSGDEFKKALDAENEVPHIDLEECSTQILLKAADRCLDRSESDPEKKNLLEILKTVMFGSKVELEEWFKDFKINATKHPDPWAECASILQRAMLGELKNENRNMAFKEAENSLIEWFDSDNIHKTIWAKAWTRQMNLIKNGLES